MMLISPIKLVTTRFITHIFSEGVWTDLY